MAVAADPRPRLEPGVSLALAQWRAKVYRDVRYRLDLSVRAGADALEGHLEVAFSFRGEPVDLVLDWRGGDPAKRVTDLRVNGAPASAARFESEHLVVPGRSLKRGANTLSLAFSSPVSAAGGPVTRYADSTDGAEYWHTLFVPADASNVFPCFDQPDLKARFELTVTAPPGWRVIGNAPLQASEREVEVVRHHFAATEPISTYLFAFAAGPFEPVIEAGASSKPGPVTLYARRSKAAQARAEAPAVLDLNRRAIAWFARYFARPFPFAKYDLVLVPELAYGGMEHAGATFLREESVLFPFQPAASDRLRRAQLVLHETAHQWFGDLVTMRWFDDLWLKEGFANFMAAKAAAELLRDELPGLDPWIAFNAVKSAAYRTDATKGTTPIWQSMPNLASAKSAYGNIVYSKAPAVLRQAEHYIGETAFRHGVRHFLARHAFGAASWSDLVRALERASGEDLKAWADTWVKRRGMPRIVATRDERDGKLRGIRLMQEDVLREGGRWPMRLRLVALSGGEAGRRDVRLTEREIRMPIRVSAPVDLVFANDGDFGYGQFLLDPASAEYALANIGRIEDDLLRALVLDSLWESVREAELDPARYLQLAMQWLPEERDELTGVVLLARLRSAYLRYLAPARRDAMAPAVEDFVALQLSRAPSESRRIAYFRAFVDVARSVRARDRLKALLAGKERIEGVPLRSRDRFRIVESLLASGDPEAPSLLEAQAREDASGEGRRYAFGASAARPDAAAKRALFERFLKDEKLPESWIEEALGSFNELDHAALTRPLLDPALRALPSLKRERRIFFVNNWLAAFIGGQTDAEALKTVQGFLAEAKIDPDLRLKVLEALDVLERTVKIRTAFP
jgi:aminopeptidase N